MNRIFIIGILAVASISSSASAQRFAVKAYGDIGMGKAMSLSSTFPDMTSKSSSNAFGVDFGYTFWQKEANSLEVNLGLGYRMASSKFNVSDFSFNYAAPASADEDGDSYQRYTTISDMKQKISIGYFNIPVYLQYQYRATKWLGVHADLGFGFGFKCSGKVKSVTGRADTYGVYPQYDNLIIKADYLNDFGTTQLADVPKGEAGVKGFNASLITGVGCEFYVGGPVSIDLGVRYNAGLTKVYDSKYDISSKSSVNAENAPLTYEVARGQQVEALSDYVAKSHLNPFSLHIGVNVRF